LEGRIIHWKMFLIAFIENDTPAMQRQLEWAKSNGDDPRIPLYQALVAAYSGKVQQSRELFRHLVDKLHAGHDNEGASLVEIEEALINAQFGYLRRARVQVVAIARTLPTDKDLAALTLALAGDAARAQTLVNELENRF